MSVLATLKAIFRASTESANRGDVTDDTVGGAFWCHDCNERILDGEVADGPPTCPDCGDEMEFERSATATGCAC